LSARQTLAARDGTGPLAAGHGGAAQRRVRETMGRLGGYWRPLAGVARLLEELGELAEEELATAPARQTASELADLWIITTALADQFLAEVAEPGTAAATGNGGGDRLSSLAGLTAAAGQIARVVNYYDGPKVPREADRLPSLRDAVATFHRELSLYACARDVDLGAAVHEKLGAIVVGDSKRFARSYEDRSTEPCVEEFRALGVGPPGWEAATARLWGARVPSAGSMENQAAALAGSLRAFARAAPRERLDGYVIRMPDADTLQHWQRLLDRLSAHDPAPGTKLTEGSFGFGGLVLAADWFPPFGLLRPAPEADDDLRP